MFLLFSVKLSIFNILTENFNSLTECFLSLPQTDNLHFLWNKKSIFAAKIVVLFAFKSFLWQINGNFSQNFLWAQKFSCYLGYRGTSLFPRLTVSDPNEVALELLWGELSWATLSFDKIWPLIRIEKKWFCVTHIMHTSP